MKDLALREKFVELRAQGLSFASISAKIKVSKATLLNWNKELREDVELAQGEQIEAIRAKYRLNRAEQIERYGKWLKLIDDELSKRDFSQLRTDQLLTVATRLISEVRGYDLENGEADDQYKNVVTAEELEEMARGNFVIAG